MNDHELAGYLADLAGTALVGLRVEAFAGGMNQWDLRRNGDMLAHELLSDELGVHRPDDSILSE
ncbi:MAG: 3'(2'),5'-bisphosphate nucleotidase CysQ, partial [Acidimicrobiales bacterium]